jgi:SPP1 family predicted phage head-tail adaptor
VIRTGELREQIVIERPTPSRDAYGGQIEAWSTFASPWARVVTMKGDEALRAASDQAQHAVRFQLHHLAGVTPAMRIVWQGRTYDIREVDDSLRHQGELWITAVAKVL